MVSYLYNQIIIVMALKFQNLCIEDKKMGGASNRAASSYMFVSLAINLSSSFGLDALLFCT